VFNERILPKDALQMNVKFQLIPAVICTRTKYVPSENEDDPPFVQFRQYIKSPAGCNAMLSTHPFLRHSLMKTSNLRITSAALAAILGLSGCADMNMSDTQRNTGLGALGGAAAGAVLGRAVSGGGSTGRSTGTGAMIGAAAGGVGAYIWSRNMEEQKRRMQQATQGTGVEVTQTADNRLKLYIPSDISFDTGRADIKPNLRSVLDQFAQSLRDNPNTNISIIGHTDNTGSDAINNPLSVNRAASTRNYLQERGVNPSRIAIDGRGMHEPVADNSSDAGRARNRRVEIFVAEQQAVR
jgi:outer membrane protein OmpA-like peptidoglycan-associated protein